jgi:hypothetical protein
MRRMSVDAQVNGAVAFHTAALLAPEVNSARLVPVVVRNAAPMW